MERTNLKLSEIRALFDQGKPLYLETTHRTEDGYDVPKRQRIYGVRMWSGQFQAKLQYNSKWVWQNADRQQVVLAY